MPTRGSSPPRKLSPQQLPTFAFKVRYDLVPGQERSTHDETLHVRVRARSESRSGEDQSGSHQVIPCLHAHAQTSAEPGRITGNLCQPVIKVEGALQA